MNYQQKPSVSGSYFWFLPLLAISFSACSSFKGDVKDTPLAEAGLDGSVLDDAAGAGNDNTGGAETIAGGGGMGGHIRWDATIAGSSGTDSGSEGGAAGTTSTPDSGSDCTANKDSDGSCPWICTEVCDGKDNDCDGHTDEPVDACNLPNATSKCEQNQCAIIQCTVAYKNCDQELSNGCETPLDTLTDCGGCKEPCALLSCAEVPARNSVARQDWPTAIWTRTTVAKPRWQR